MVASKAILARDAQPTVKEIESQLTLPEGFALLGGGRINDIGEAQFKVVHLQRLLLNQC